MIKLFKCKIDDIKPGEVPKLKIKRKIEKKKGFRRNRFKEKELPKIKSIVQLTVGSEGVSRRVEH